MSSRGNKEGKSTSFNKDIPYSNDTLALIHVPRVYEYDNDPSWKKAGRYYVVGDHDVVYDAEGNQSKYEDCNRNVQYYVINPLELKCKEKAPFLNYYRAKPLSAIEETITSAKLRFVGVPLKGCFDKEFVTIDDVFDLFEPSDIGVIKRFEISQARCMFSYLSSVLPIDDVWTTPKTFEEAFERYDTINQFTDMAESYSTNPSKYGNAKFALKKKITNEEMEAIKDKKIAQVGAIQKEKLKKAERKIEQLENSSDAVKAYLVVEAKLERKKDKVLEKKLVELGKSKDKEFRKWLKYNNKVDKLKTLPKVELEVDDALKQAESAKREYIDMIFSEFIPEEILEEEDEDEDLIDESEYEGENNETETDESGTITEEEDESMESLDDSEEDDEDEEKVVDWNNLGDDDDEEEDEDFEDDEDEESGDVGEESGDESEDDGGDEDEYDSDESEDDDVFSEGSGDESDDGGEDSED